MPTAAGLCEEIVCGPHVEQQLVTYGRGKKLSWGRSQLLYQLAGRQAVHLLECREALKRDEEVDEDFWLVDTDSDDCEKSGTDLFRAIAVAKAISYPGMSERRIREQAAEWTKEMLNLPDVWATVESLADILLERGVIEDSELLESVCGGILRKAWKLPKWKRRLAVNQKWICLLAVGPSPADSGMD